MIRLAPIAAPVLLGLLLAGPGAHGLQAQALPPVEVRGKVLDDATDRPIPGVTIVVADSYGQRLARRVTDDAGEFHLQIRNRTGVQVTADRIGYQRTSATFLPFDGGDFFIVEVRLSTQAVLLAPLEVVAKSERFRSPILFDFDRRARDGFGWYFTRQDIAAIRPAYVSDVIAAVPGVRLETSGGGNRRRTVTMARAPMGMGGGVCPVQIFVDGRLITRGPVMEVPIDDLVTPEAVEGIEVYRGLSTVPAEFLTPNSRCGVVAIWTRRGG
jgi:hypothetical protein